MQKLMKVRCLTLVLCFFACSMQMVLAQLPLRNANNAGIGDSLGMEDEQEKANRTTWGRYHQAKEGEEDTRGTVPVACGSQVGNGDRCREQ